MQGSISIFVTANDEGCHPTQWRFQSILAKDLPTHHHGLRMDRGRPFTAYLDEISSLITVLEMLTSSHLYWNIILEKEYRKWPKN